MAARGRDVIAAHAASPPLGLGILGTGYIGAQFAAGVADSPAVRVTAVASRTEASASAFARRFDLAQAHASYEALLEDPAVDAVYIGLPNSLHAEWTLRAAACGKHVLCEKPLATGRVEAAAMFAAARRGGVVLLEAFPYCFQPQTIESLRRIHAGELGSIRVVQASLGFSVTKPDSIRLNRDLAGGALLDAGCYPVSFARLVHGARPIDVDATSQWGPTGVDLTTVATLRYPGGGVAQIACSIVTSLYREAVVLGSDGVIETPYSNHTAPDRPALFREKRGIGWDAAFDEVASGSGNGFRFEVEAFARMVRGDAPGEAAAWEAISLDNAATLEAILESARSSKRVVVGPIS